VTSATGAPPARLVVRAPNWLGDAVLALPAMRAMRVAWPAAHIAVAAIPSVAPVFLEDTSADADAVLAIEGDEAAALARGRYDTVVLLPNSFRSAWNARRAGIPARWGYAAEFRRPLLTRAVPRPGRVHQAEYYSHLARALGCEPGVETPRVTPRPRTTERAAALLAGAGIPGDASIVGLAPGAAGGHAKRWPPDRVAALVRRLLETPGIRCVLVGAAGDRAAGREIESALPDEPRLVNLIGRTDLRVLTGVLGACRVFVSNDSGAMHLAAAVGVPVVAIFGPTDERATAPVGDHDVIVHPVFCRPCMLRDCPIDHRCMTRISVDEVHAAVLRRLARAA
jgi:heptosyltransferase-2